MIVSFIIIFIGMFTPQLALSFLKYKYRKRIYVLLIYGFLTLVSSSAYQISIEGIEKARIKDEQKEIEDHIDYYNAGIDRQLQRIKSHRTDMAKLLKESQENERDEDWTLNFNATINAMETTMEEARYLEPPKEYEAAHELYLKAIDKLSSTPEKMPDVMANKDADLFRSVREDENEALGYLEEFIAMIQEIRKQER